MSRFYSITVQHWVDGQVTHSDTEEVDPPETVDDIRDMFQNSMNWIEERERDHFEDEMHQKLARMVGCVISRAQHDVSAFDIDYDPSSTNPNASFKMTTPDGPTLVTIQPEEPEEE